MEINRVAEIVISGIGPMCPQINELEQLRTFQDGDNAINPDWFDPQKYLGPKGFKYFTTAARYLLASSKLSLEDSGVRDDSFTPEEKGVIIGSNFASFNVLQAMDSIILKEGAPALNPMQAADFCINIPTGYVSIKHGFKGFNLTLTNPLVAGLESIIYARDAIIDNRAQLVIAGATEDTVRMKLVENWGIQQFYGAACTVTLETKAGAMKRKKSFYTKVGKSLMKFIPPDRLTDEGTRILAQAQLTKELIPMLPKAQKTIHFAAPNGNFLVNQTVYAMIQTVLTEQGISVSEHRFFDDKTSYGTVSPVCLVGLLAARYGEGLVLATSPYGHVVIVNLEKIGS